jgi:hypothetical protein
VIQGEIDIVEGVNDQFPNAATLHTTEGKILLPKQTFCLLIVSLVLRLYDAASKIRIRVRP